MWPARYDLVDTIDLSDPLGSKLRGIRAGADWTSPTFRFGTAFGGPYRDLTGKEFAFQIRDAKDGRGLLANVTTQSGNIINGGVAGSLVVLLSEELTGSLFVGRYIYGLYETSPGNTPYVEGLIDVVKAAVR